LWPVGAAPRSRSPSAACLDLPAGLRSLVRGRFARRPLLCSVWLQLDSLLVHARAGREGALEMGRNADDGRPWCPESTRLSAGRQCHSGRKSSEVLGIRILPSGRNASTPLAEHGFSGVRRGWSPSRPEGSRSTDSGTTRAVLGRGRWARNAFRGRLDPRRRRGARPKWRSRLDSTYCTTA
jgi:hypothetical protein